MGPQSEDVQWLRDNNVHVLFNDLATEMLLVKPDDVLNFVWGWCGKKKEREKSGSLVRRPSRGELNTPGGSIPPPPPAPPPVDNFPEPVHMLDDQITQQPPPPVINRPPPSELLERHTSPEGIYDVQTCIGEGHYGRVYHATELSTNRVVAIKKVTIDGDWIEQEIQNLKHCNSDWVVKLLNSHYSVEEDMLWIVMEMLGTSMAHVADAAGPRAFSEYMIVEIVSQMLAGLEALHAFGRVHLDIKPGNLLLNEPKTQLKIADFGTMQRIGDECVQLGDFAFMSPEVAYSSGKYISQSDIWSLGVTSLYLADGEAPLWREKPELLMFIHRETCMV